MKVVIVVPTYNEAENLTELTDRIWRVTPHADLLLVDDGSPDGTADLADRLFSSKTEYASHRVIRRTGPRGLGRAYRDGFQSALSIGYDRIIQMDADLSHNPSYLNSLLNASKNADLVIGSRYCEGGGVENWAASRLILSRFACAYVHRVARVPVADATAGYRCWTRRALEAIDLTSLYSEGYSFQVEMAHRAHRAGMRIVETPIVFTDRRYGRSKISRTVLIESFLVPWRLRLNPWIPGEILSGALTAENASSGAGGK